MTKKFKKDDEEFAIFNEFWHIMQEYWEPEFTDEYWDHFIDALNDFEARHKGNKLCELMIILALEFMQDKYNQGSVSVYMALIKRVRYAYEKFLKQADEKDKEILGGLLKEERYASEKDLLMAIVRTLALQCL